jgi:Holliday junction resolvase
MRYETVKKLKKLKEKFNPKELGQIFQDLLAIAFSKIGIPEENIDVSNVEGVDIIIDNENFGKYAIEVKTTSTDYINFGQKDLEGLKKYQNNGYKSYLAAFKLKDLDFAKWIFMSINNLPFKKSNLSVNSLFTSDDFKEEAKKLNEEFENLLNDYADEILKNGLKYLTDEIKRRGLKCSGG